MRRITVSCLALLLILLGHTHPGSAQNVTIELTPITYPIVLPDSGGSFDYLLTVTNQGGTPITATVWCMATLPNGGSWGPVAGPATQTLAAGQTQGYYRTQTIPPRAPFGYYMFHAYVGIYPDTIWAQDSLEFQHQAISGVEQEWVARYNGPGNASDNAHWLAVDGGGNVYVTGWSYGSGMSEDYATIKYNAAGEPQWAARYDGPGNGIDEALSLAVDGDDYVYVTGWSDGGGFNYDYATVKYDASGNQIWAARYNGPGDDNDVACSLVADDSGNVYVTGASSSSGTNYDYTTVKYDASGHQIWAARYNGPGNDDDYAYCLTVGGGHVYVTGWSYGIGTQSDYTTIKYDASGHQIWVARYDGPANNADYAHSLAVDGAGNVYVTGGSHGLGTNIDYATVKYDASGNQIWVARYDGPTNDDDWAYSLAVNNGSLYVTGYSNQSTGYIYNYDYATVKYDSQGMEQWVARYNGPGDDWDQAKALAVDSEGSVYVTGFCDGQTGETNYDYATIKYDSSGNQIWEARYNGPGNDWDKAYSLAMDSAGNVYVTGESDGGRTNYDYCTIKYSGGNIANWMPVEATVLGQPLPQECRLEGNFPNPFNASTAISYELRAASYVSLNVYDTAGRLVKTLVDGWRSAGEHELTWDAAKMAAGIYFAKMEAGEYVGVQKLILLK